MIQKLALDREEMFLSILRNCPCVGARMEVDYQIQKSNSAMPYRFYLLGHRSGLELSGRSAVVCGIPAEEEETGMFLSFSGVNRLISDGWVPSGWHSVPYLKMVWRGEKSAQPLYLDGIDKMPSAQQLMSVLEHPDGPAWPEDSRNGYYADLCARRNRNMAAVWGIWEDTKLVSTAGVYALTGQEAYIACVETIPGARHKGYAKRLVRVLCQEYAGHNITLMCEAQMEGFYQQLGFATLPGRCTMAVDGIEMPHIPGLAKVYVDTDTEN